MKKTSGIALTLLAALVSTCFSWQQKVAYNIEARLDTVEHTIHAVQHLWYYNNSPDTLRTV